MGLAGAGLLSFPQALGIVLGANVGTTATGWIVALLGFKLKLGLVMLPLVMVGVGLRLFGRHWVASAGYAIAGFGLVFVGIATLQAGMEGLQGIVTPERFPGETIGGRLQLVAIGIAVTIVTQSSSAGVATMMKFWRGWS